MKFPAQGPMSVAEMEYENFQGQNFILFRDKGTFNINGSSDKVGFSM